jgi:hypothetical protein
MSGSTSLSRDPAVLEGGRVSCGNRQLATVELTLIAVSERSGACGRERLAADSDLDVAPLATVTFGKLLGSENDVAGAIATYRQAVDSGHPTSPVATD